MTRAALLVLVACKSSVGVSVDASSGDDASADAPSDGPVSPLALSCAATTGTTVTPGPCPAPTDAKATFCYRPRWPGVTSVDVVGGFLGNDWTSPLVTLADDGTGTFTGSVPLATGTYSYAYRVHGSADGLVRDNECMNDEENPTFAAPPPESPCPRSVSVMTIPQVAVPALHHVHAVVTYAGIPQACFSVSLLVGELRGDKQALISERGLANVAETAADGTFDFPIADGTEMQAAVRFPFGLADAYPDPATTPSIGFARQQFDMAGADVALDPVDVSYGDYALMSPVAGAQTIPTTFTYSVVAGSTDAAIAVIATNLAGKDPGFESPFDGGPSFQWNGVFSNGKMEVTGTQYYWGAWQHRGAWTDESLLFPITFQ